MDNKILPVTPESQKAHVKEIKSLLDRLAKKDSYTLNEGELNTVIRALMCHMFIIELDLKRQKNEQNKETKIN